MPHQIKMENLAIEERINRMIPTPAGVTDIPLGLDEELSKKLEEVNETQIRQSTL